MRWEKLRLRGKRYVVARQALFVAAALFIILNFGAWIITGNPMPTAFLFLYPAVGLVAGLVVWSVNEDRFEQFLADKKANSVFNKKRKSK